MFDDERPNVRDEEHAKNTREGKGWPSNAELRRGLAEMRRYRREEQMSDTRNACATWGAGNQDFVTMKNKSHVGGEEI